MELIFISLFFAITVFALFLYFEWKEKYLLAFFFKGCSSLFFFVLLFMSYLYYISVPITVPSIITYQRFFANIGIGLGFGFLGDLVLALRSLLPKSENQRIIFLGTMSFLIGHLFYIRALGEYTSFNGLLFLFSALVTLTIFLIAKKIHSNFGKLFLPSVIYSYILFLFVGQVIFGYSTIPFPIFKVTILIGSILFAVSDLILSQIYYNNQESKILKSINLVTYYVAQYLIALSLFFMVI